MKERIKAIQRKLGIKDDGDIGNETLTALEKALGIVETPAVVTSKKWPKPDYASMVAFYGEVGTNQTTLQLPYPMVLAWDQDTTVTKITCHNKCKDAFYNIFKKTLDHYGIEQIKKLGLDQYGGCLNVRKMRGGSQWSTHAWGCAIDIDPDNNQLKWGKDKAKLAKPEYNQFWKFVEEEGGYSLGRKKNYDWMHTELVSH